LVATFSGLLPHTHHHTSTLSGCVSGDLLESEQNASMQLRKDMVELEKRVEQLQGTNNSLDKQVGSCL